MQLEGVGCVSMRHFFFEICWQVDDRDSFKWTSRNRISTQNAMRRIQCIDSLFDADTTTDTQEL